MDKIHFAPPKKPWNDGSPVNTQKHGFNQGFKVVRADFATIHSICVAPFLFSESSVALCPATPSPWHAAPASCTAWSQPRDDQPFNQLPSAQTCGSYPKMNNTCSKPTQQDKVLVRPHHAHPAHTKSSKPKCACRAPNSNV